MAKGIVLMEIENLKAQIKSQFNSLAASYKNLSSLVASCKKVGIVLFCFLCVYLAFIDGCFGNFRKNAVLVVYMSDEPDTDVLLIKNTLRNGGLLKCGTDEKYVKFVQSIDSSFIAYTAFDSKGAYRIQPALWNWICSQGWKFQQKFCINLNEGNAEYYFVK